MNVKVTLTGVEEIDAVFKGLPTVLQDKVLQDAHAKAVSFTVNRAKLLAPEGPTGNLVDSIGVVRARGKGRTEMGLVYAGPRRRGKNRAPHAHLVEFGTKRRENKRGANRGVMPAKPFMQPAWNQTKGEVMRVIPVELGRKVYAFMRRTIKKFG